MKLITPLAILIATASATPSAAQKSSGTAKSPALGAPASKAPVATPPTNDANCLLVSNIFAQQSTDATQKAHAGNVFFYYFGRLDARASEAQWKNELKQAGTTQFTPETASALMNSCVQNMQSRAQVLQNATQQLDQHK
ncbi:MAG TPA: hypothetical protein VGU01_09260 [Sphingomicrobium sp.]|nr:hypothetical protein [Sphingomicrobium sp.]